MAYDMSEILKLPAEEQEEIANAIYRHLHSSIAEDVSVEKEIAGRFQKIESGDYKGYTIDEVKEKLSAKWQSKSSL